MTVRFQKGLQHMNGERALQYARTRHDSNDFDRARRQQQIILAVRDKIMNLQVPLDRIPALLATLGESIQTDMTLDEIYAVYQAARDVQVSNIKQGVIDETMTVPWVTAQGAEVLLPQRDKIRVLVGKLFPVPVPTVSLGPLGDPTRLAQEAARVEIQNGTQTAGLASKVAAELRAAGYNVVRFGNADRFDYQDTLIVDYTAGKPYTLASLKERFKIPDAHVMHQDIPADDVDIRVILGGR